MRVGSDTGGTFTDLIDEQGRIRKVLSTPADPARAVAEGLVALGVDRPELIAHGTTVATNALLERRGTAVALVTNRGLADVIEIGRQDRPSLYELYADRPPPLVPRDRRVEIGGRLDAAGAELEPVPAHELRELVDRFDPDAVAVAVCLLHADLAPGHEQTVAAALEQRGVDVTASHQVSPTYREFERSVTTVVNAYLRPVCRRYVGRLAGLADQVLVMTSAGGLLPAGDAAEVPVTLALSGPAGGVRAAVAAALANGEPDVVTFDMGGTSTDVCLVRDGRPEPAAERTVAGLPLRVPALDVATIGAGGGSIAWLDAGGALRVGPHSAGADPGPVCYGRGGVAPTVTDANLVMGRIPADAALAGIGPLHRDAARAAFARVGVDPAGVLAVVDAAMEETLRAVTVARGVDPRDCALVAFGGAGPLHAASLAQALGMGRVVVPARAGVLSAAGVLGAPVQRDLVRTWPTPHDPTGLGEALGALGDEAARLVGAGATVTTAVECRYAGQSHELRVGDPGSFHEAHRRRNGYARPDAPVEVVALRATAEVASPVDLAALAAPDRPGGTGPAVLAEADCTVWVPPGWRARPGAAGALILEAVDGSVPAP